MGDSLQLHEEHDADHGEGEKIDGGRKGEGKPHHLGPDFVFVLQAPRSDWQSSKTG